MKPLSFYMALTVFACSLPAAAAGVANPKELLGTLKAAGFAGTANVPIPDAAPVVAAAAQASASPAEVSTILTAFAQEVVAQPKEGSLSGGAARLLGFTPTAAAPWNAAGNMPLSGISRHKNSTGETKNFYATNSRGSLEIIIVYMKDGVEVRAYLVGLDGKLRGAVRETSAGDTSTSLSEAEAAFQAELGFWVRYYNSTHPKP